MFDIVIRSKADLRDACSEYKATHVISIQDAAEEHEPTKTPSGITEHQHFFFDDLDLEDLAKDPTGRNSKRYGSVHYRHRFPSEKNVTDILAFAAAIPDGSKLFIHCFAGISRSTAMGFAILCQMLGPGKEGEAFKLMYKAAIHAMPNDLIIQMADRILDRKGAMIRILDKYNEVIKKVGVIGTKLALMDELF